MIVDRHQPLSGIEQLTELSPQWAQERCQPLALGASPEEFRRVYTLLRNPPAPDVLSPAQHRMLLNEVTQAVLFCVRQPRCVHNEIINRIVQRALDNMPPARGEPRWQLEKIDDRKRTGVDRTYTFGQVTVNKEECFAGIWHVVSENREALLHFKINAVAELIGYDRDQRVTHTQLQSLAQRGANSWQIQVPNSSKTGEWITAIYGSSKLGFFEGYRPLGVFADAIRRFCDEEGVSHLLLPRSRRDPGTKPWHIGAFMSFHGDRFVWSGWGLDRNHSPIQLYLGIRPYCEILGLRPLPGPGLNDPRLRR